MLISPRSCRSELVPAFVRLLRDSEAEVRGAAGGKVAQFCSLLGANESCVIAVLPCVKELASDSNQFVRASLASVVMELAPMLGKAATIEHLLPVFLALLKDDFPEVRLNIISKLDQVRLGHTSLDPPPPLSPQLLPPLASVVMELASMLGKAATIEHLLPVFLALLKGDFPEVRLKIISKLDQMRLGHTSLDPPPLSPQLLPPLASVVMKLTSMLGKAATIEHLLPVFLALLKGDFPEVRLNIISKLDQMRLGHTSLDSPPPSPQLLPPLASVVMELAFMLGKAATIEHLLPVFLALLKGDFPEVRLKIISKLGQMRLGHTSLDPPPPPPSPQLLPPLASVVMELAFMLGKAATIEHLLPVFLALLKGDFPEVRLNIISKLDQVRLGHTSLDFPPSHSLSPCPYAEQGCHHRAPAACVPGSAEG